MENDDAGVQYAMAWLTPLKHNRPARELPYNSIVLGQTVYAFVGAQNSVALGHIPRNGSVADP